MIAYINERLNDWARWQVSDRRLLRTLLGAHNCWPQMLGEAQSTATVRQRGTLVPVNDGECCETDRAVCALRVELKEPVVAYYTRIGTGEMLAKRLGISKRTLFYRIDMAHDEIVRTLGDAARNKELMDSDCTKEYKPGYAAVNLPRVSKLTTSLLKATSS